MREICSIHEILQIYNLISPSISENKIDIYFQTAGSACNLWKTETGQSVQFKPLGWKACYETPCYRQGFLHTWWSENSSYLKNLPVGCSVPSIVWGWVDGAECPAHIAARSAPDPTLLLAPLQTQHLIWIGVLAISYWLSKKLTISNGDWFEIWRGKQDFPITQCLENTGTFSAKIWALNKQKYGQNSSF